MSRLRSLPMRLWQRLQDLSGKRMALAVPPGEHVFSVNLGGGSVTVQGQRWMSHDEALAAGLALPGASVMRTHLAPRPYAEPGLRAVLNSVAYRASPLGIGLPLPAGEHELWLWFMENFRSELHSLTLAIDGVPVASGLAKLPKGGWGRWGPFPMASDGATPVRLTLDSAPFGGDAHLMGLSVYRR